MAETEEPQFTTLAERIAALNKQKNFVSTPEPQQHQQAPVSHPQQQSQAPAKRRPPPPPPGASAVRSQTLPFISTTEPANSPSIPPRPARVKSPQIPQASPQALHNARPAPPPLPTRKSSSSQISPSLPPRHASAQSTLMVRRNSGSSEISQHSTMSSLSLGHTSITSFGSDGASRKLPPTYDPSSLPALPPTKRVREAAAQAAKAEASAHRFPLKSAKTAPVVRQIEAAPPITKPNLPPRLPSRPVKPAPAVPTSTVVETARPEQPARRLPPPPASYVTSPQLNGTVKETPSPPQRPQIPQRPSSQQPPQHPPRSTQRPPIPSQCAMEDDAPPPVPMASRPTAEQIEAVNSRDLAPPVRDDCFICRDWSGPDGVAAQFPRDSLPRNDPVGYLAHGLCSPFPSYTEKARAIFTWFHYNIRYDTVSFFGNCVKHMSVEDTIFSGLAVCQGYAETYKAIANRAGLECLVVVGHGKGYGHTPLKKGERPPPPKPDGHAWTAVRIDGGVWKLLDACWGAGHLDSGTGTYKQEFSPTQFTRSNDKFGLSHFPQNSQHQFRDDGRIMSWEEYFIGPVSGETPIFYTNGHEEGIAEDSVEPKERQISVYSGEMVRFQFSKICEHWTSETHGLGKPPLLLLSINGLDGRNEKMIPIETNGYWHWIDIDARELGAPGQTVSVLVMTSFDGRDACGLTAQEFLSKKGRVGMAYAGVVKWELV